jgi:hypothetical protein
MSDPAPVVRRIPAPGRPLWWLVGASVVGIVAPSLIAAIVALAAYYPIGSFLPRLPLLMSLIGAALGMIAAAALVLFSGIVVAIVRLNWRPVALAAITVGATAIGFVPGLWCFVHAKHYAYSLLGVRSAALLNAIEGYEQAKGVPPSALAELMPAFMPSIPGTGMAAYPDYEYARDAGPCPDGNRWHLLVDAGELLQWDFFFYCPRKDYSALGWGGSNEVMGDWAYLHE